MGDEVKAWLLSGMCTPQVAKRQRGNDWPAGAAGCLSIMIALMFEKLLGSGVGHEYTVGHRLSASAQ